MKRLRFGLFVLSLLIGLCVGLYLTFLPQINTAVYDFQTTTVLTEMEQQIADAEAELPASAEDVRIYEELFAAMVAYNQQLAESGQAGMTGPEDYETPALTLPDYGLKDDSPIGSVSIPSIDVELPLYLGATEEHMSLGAVVLGQTSVPIGGEHTNCVVAGHRGYRGIPYFRYLDRLEPGDVIYLTNFWGRMTYVVRETAIIEPDDVDAILIREGKDMLTLLTCHPYTVGTQRLVIYCERSA